MNVALIVSIVAILMAVGGLIFFIFMELRYKHRVIIREMTNGRKIIKIDKARDYTDNDKVCYWLLKKERDKIKKKMPMPPSESIDITNKGKKYVECYRSEMGEYVFISDNGKTKDVPYELLEDWGIMPKFILNDTLLSERQKEMAHNKYIDDQEKKWKEDNNIITPLKPLSTDQRLSLVNNIKKAELRGMNDWKKDIPVIISIASFVVLVTIAAIFLPDAITTYTDGANQISNSIKSYEHIRHENLMMEMQQWEKISQGIQTVNNLQLENQKRLDELEQNKKNE